MNTSRYGLLGMLFALGACTAPATLSDDFGNAVRHNKAMHIINPPASEAVVSDMNGPRAAGAIDRYESGTVIPPRTLSTTTGIGSSTSGQQ